MLAVTPPTNPGEFKTVLDGLTEGLMNTADGPLLAAGNTLWLGLSAIIVVWHGARTALSGEAFNAWETIKLIIVLSIPRGMLEFYATPFPGLGLTSPRSSSTRAPGSTASSSPTPAAPPGNGSRTISAASGPLSARPAEATSSPS